MGREQVNEEINSIGSSNSDTTSICLGGIYEGEHADYQGCSEPTTVVTLLLVPGEGRLYSFQPKDVICIQKD